MMTDIVVDRSDQYRSNHQKPICQWDVKLAMEDL